MSYWSRVNLGLVIVLAILTATLYWPEERPATASLTALSSDGVTSIRVERNRRLVLALQRGPQGWGLTHPQAGIAKEQRVERLLSILDAPVLQRIAAESTAADFGLDSPSALIRFDDLDIRFGNSDLSRQLRYVDVGGNVSVIDDAFFNLLALPASHYLEP